MSRTKQNPIEQRRVQIEKELEKLDLPKNIKTRRDFKSEEAHKAWKDRSDQKRLELNEEVRILGNPFEYNEIPLAAAAAELGVTLNEMLEIVSEDLVEITFCGEYKAGMRITRDEMGRAIEVGSAELLRIANQSVEEIFEEAIEFFRTQDVEAAEQACERIERSDYKTYHQYRLASDIGLHLLKGEFDDLQNCFYFTKYYHGAELAAILKEIRRAVEVIQPTNHLATMVQENILAVVSGAKDNPFDDTYSRYKSSDYFSKMTENQRHAMFLGTIVMESIKRYKFIKSIESKRHYFAPPNEEEIERVVRNAIFTALEAESTYHDSPSSKLFVDKFVDLFPKRWIPAELISFLPESSKKVADNHEFEA